MKIKFRSLLLLGYGGGVVGGLLIAVIGILTNSHHLAVAGVICAVATGVVCSIPLMIAGLCALNKRRQDLFKKQKNV
jgi:hypothetical protein